MAITEAPQCMSTIDPEMILCYHGYDTFHVNYILFLLFTANLLWSANIHTASVPSCDSDHGDYESNHFRKKNKWSPVWIVK